MRENGNPNGRVLAALLSLHLPEGILPSRLFRRERGGGGETHIGTDDHRLRETERDRSFAFGNGHSLNRSFCFRRLG